MSIKVAIEQMIEDYKVAQKKLPLYSTRFDEITGGIKALEALLKKIENN